MRESCTGCGESFKSENMSRCGDCGRELCYRCMAVHEGETGHSKSKNPWTSEAWERAGEFLKDMETWHINRISAAIPLQPVYDQAS
jgi:hypothetical protein